MQRVQKKDHFIARLKHPPKEDWREKLARNQKSQDVPVAFVQQTAPFMPEGREGPITTLRGILAFGLFANAAYTATQPTRYFSNTDVEYTGNNRSTIK